MGELEYLDKTFDISAFQYCPQQFFILATRSVQYKATE
jgi:hypothetical protein